MVIPTRVAGVFDIRHLLLPLSVRWVAWKGEAVRLLPIANRCRQRNLTLMVIYGSCHCGNISFELAWEPDPSEIPARACGCSFCAKHGGVWTSNPNASLRVNCAEPPLVSKYSFGTRTALFHVCARCGIVPVVTSLIDAHLYAVVSVNAFNNVDQSLVRRAPASFEDESVESRLARRKRNWIADVQYAESGT